VVAHITKAHLYAGPAAALEGVPNLWLNNERRSQKPLLHEVCARLPAHAVVCPADWLVREYRDRWSRVPVHRIHPGVELDATPSVRDHTAGAQDAVVVGVVGRLQRWKRVELAVQALPGILNHVPGARLRVIGGTSPGLDDDYPAEIEAEARRLGVAHALQMTGHVDDAAAAIRGLDVLVHPAHDEPFGLVLVEAMAAGVPVVAAREGGPLEIVRPGVDGLLIDVTDPAVMAGAVVGLVRDPALRSAMGAAGRARALDAFSSRRLAAEAWDLTRVVAGAS